MPYYANNLPSVFTALVTPFDASGQLDERAFGSLVENQLDAGVQGLVPVGTTGESSTLNEDERDRIISATVRVAAGKSFVMAGTGSNNTERAIAWTRKAELLGADGCLVVTPYYNKPSQEGLRRYFSAIAESTKLPVMLYSVPGRCGVEIAPQTAAVLHRNFANIIGIKEAGGSVDRVTELRKACGQDFVIYCGDDALTLPFLATGASGVISVVSNLAPALLIDLIAAWRQGETHAACEIHDRIHALSKAIFVESNPVPIKTALALRGQMHDFVRSPLAPLSSGSLQFLQDTLASVMLS